MDNVKLLETTLDDEGRATLGRLFGCQIEPTENVVLLVVHAHEAPQGKVRSAAWNRLTQSLDAMGDQTRHLADDQVDNLVDDAMRHVRPSYERTRS